MIFYFNEDSAPLYAVIYRRSDGKVWDTVSSALATYVAGSHANYGINLTQVAGDRYSLTEPALGAGVYDVLFYYRIGASKDVADTIVGRDVLTIDTTEEEDDSSLGGIPGLTKLAAVNKMLGSIQESPVVELDTGGSSEAADAERILDEASEEIQTEQAWHFNTEEVELARDADNKIPLSGTYIRVDATTPSVDVVRRGEWLYDRDNGTYTFSTNIDATVSRLIDFANCPPAFKHYVVAAASVRFQMEMQGSDKQDTRLERQMILKRRAALDEDSQSDDRSILDHSTSREVLGRPWRPRF